MNDVFIANEKGQVGIIFAIVIIAVLMMVALVIDVGQAYLEKSRLQTTTDAAALAAAQDLSKGESQSQASLTAQDYVDKNSSESLDGVEITFPTLTKVRVEAQESKVTFFARIFGNDIVQVSASSEAEGGLATAVLDVVPIIVPSELVADHIGSENEAQFNIGSDGDGPGGGVFWLVDLGNENAGTPVFEEWIINGYPNPVTIGDFAGGEGVKAALKSALEIRMADNPRLILPLYNSATQGNTHDYQVSGFAEFVITDFKLTGHKYFRGYFTTGEVVKGVSGDEVAPDFGVVVLKLTE